MQAQFIPRLPNSSGYGQKKITQQTQPKNLPQGETFELTIDIIQDQVCLFVKKDDKLFEAIETLLLEKDIVNIVNQKPEVHKKNQQLQLRYEGFPIIELKQVQEFYIPSKPVEQNEYKEESDSKPQITVDAMYNELNYKYKNDISIQKNIYELKLKTALEELEEMKKKFADLDRMKKEFRDNEIIKTLQAKMQVQEKEIEKLPVYNSLIQNWENIKEKITQLVYLKMANYFECMQENSNNYYIQKQMLDKRFFFLQDDIRRLKARKVLKEAEECEKKILLMEQEYLALEQSSFFIMEYKVIDHDFLNCDETIVYKNQILELQEQVEEANQQVQMSQNMVLAKKKEFNEFKLSVDKVQIQTVDLIEKNNQLRKEIEENQTQLKENSHWKDKYIELQKITNEMKIKQENRIKGLEAHVLIKDTQVKQVKKEIDEKEEEFKIQKNCSGEKGQEERYKILSEEIVKQKKCIKTVQLQEKITKQQNDFNIKREHRAKINAELSLIEAEIEALEENKRNVQDLLEKQYESLQKIQTLKKENDALSKQNIKLNAQLRVYGKQLLDGEYQHRTVRENEILQENQINLIQAIIRKKEAEVQNLSLKLKLKAK